MLQAGIMAKNTVLVAVTVVEKAKTQKGDWQICKLRKKLELGL